ncbi:unnamed protein product, partial [Brachionus calyciflorus]
MSGTTKCGLSSKSFILENLLGQEFSECKSEKTCYGFGDPHYRTLNGNSFTINKTCSYVLATDFCE